MIKIGIYPGRFQPAHLGHLRTLEYLKKVIGNDQNVYIVTSNKVETGKSPLNFNEKQQILVRHGIDINNIIMVKSPYNPIELLSRFDANNTIVIIAVGSKDMKIGDARFKFAPKKDGSPSYFQPYNGDDSKLQPFSKHIYIIEVPENISQSISGTDIRNVLGNNRIDESDKKKYFIEVFGWFDIGLYNLMKEKFSGSNNMNIESKFRKTLKKIFEKIMIEAINTAATPSGTTTSSTTSKDPNLDNKQAKLERDQERADRLAKDKERALKVKQLDAERKKAEYMQKELTLSKNNAQPSLTKQIQDLSK